MRIDVVRTLPSNMLVFGAHGLVHRLRLLLLRAHIAIISCIHAAVVVHIQKHSTKRFLHHLDTALLVLRLFAVGVRCYCLLMLPFRDLCILCRHGLVVVRAIIELPASIGCSSLILLRLLLLFIIIDFHN